MSVRRRWMAFFCVAAIAAVGVRSFGQGTPLSRNEHPRLGMTVDDLPAIGARLSTGGAWHDDYQRFVDYISSSAVWNTSSTSANTKPVLAAAAGFVYAVWPYVAGISYTTNGSHADSRAEWAAKGIQWLMETVDGTVSIGGRGTVEPVVRPHFFAFDWLYDAMSPAQRAAVVNRWQSDMSGLPGTPTETSIGVAERSFPSYSGFNWADSQYPLAYGAWVLAGLAGKGYGGVHEAFLQTGIDRYHWAFRNSGLGAQAIVTQETRRAGSDGGFVQNESYGFNYTMPRVVPTELAYRTASGLPRSVHYAAESAGWIRAFPEYYLRYLDPHSTEDGSFLGRDYHFVQSPGQTLNSRDVQGSILYALVLGILRGELQEASDKDADLAAWLLINRTIGENLTMAAWWPFTKFLHAKNVAKDPTTLGLKGDKAFAAGRWHWRTGFGRVQDALVMVFADKFFAGFHDTAPGSFIIYYNGPAMPHGHVYNHEADASLGWGMSTIGFPTVSNSINGVLETSHRLTTDYGYKRQTQSTQGFLNLTDGSTADYLGRPVLFRSTDADSEGVGYLWLDLSRAYQGDVVDDGSSNPRRIVFAHRKFIYFPPRTPGVDSLRLFVFDSAQTKSTAYEKRQSFVLAFEPVIDGTEMPGPVRNGSAANKFTYSGARTIAHSQAIAGSNRTWISPFTPAERTVVKVAYRRGGLVEDPYGRTHEATVLGSGINDAHRGAYRVEIIPNTGQLVDHLCTGIEVAPSAGAAQAPSEAVVGTGFVGGRIGDTVAVHKTTSSAEGGSFVLSTPGTYRVYVAGLGRSASHTVSGGANIGSVRLAATGSSCAGGCTATPQGTLYLSVVVAAAGTGASNVITVGPGIGGLAPPSAPSGVRIIPGAGGN